MGHREEKGQNGLTGRHGEGESDGEKVHAEVDGEALDPARSFGSWETEVEKAD